MSARVVVLLVAVLALGCGETFIPETIVKDLRVLGVRASPAELKPGETAVLRALVKDPSRAAPPTYFWVGCDPDPFDLNRSACSDPAVLQDFSKLTAPGATLPEGVRLIGFNDQAAYGVPADLFRNLPEGDPRRIEGTVGYVLVVAVAETVSPAASREELEALFARVRSGEVKSVVALFRIRVSESTERNLNPEPTDFVVAGEAQPLGARTLLFPAEKVVVSLEATEASFEPYVQTQPNGTVENKTENVVTAWYSSSGRFSQPRLALRSEVQNVFTAPGDPEFPNDVPPPNRKGAFSIVMRDARGGNAWREAAFFLCDSSDPEPQVTEVVSPASASEVVELRGSNLDRLVDVVVQGRALSLGAASPDGSSWRAFLPMGLASGPTAMELRGSGCTRVTAAQPLVVP